MQEFLRFTHPKYERMTIDSMLASGYSPSACGHIKELEAEVCTLRQIVAELLAKNQELRTHPFAFPYGAPPSPDLLRKV
ncbi:bZIP transcription factor [Terriglobus saanensis]|uniref:Uncharacterized protein n=1 Tax=Terriglobus saanensis (strain ATCC BAA-1853 / DSM 23119 / SP1PR4) TaxID=401053 RepID=E8V0H3_TERSS|nr:bZIP transcription factor [Terriglobus saanensis]ADV84456.1 hypothetical protein AciPR4_3705 [Terriglobus saanensis SP1PR4]